MRSRVSAKGSRYVLFEKRYQPRCKCEARVTTFEISIDFHIRNEEREEFSGKCYELNRDISNLTLGDPEFPSHVTLLGDTFQTRHKTIDGDRPLDLLGTFSNSLPTASDPTNYRRC